MDREARERHASLFEYAFHLTLTASRHVSRVGDVMAARAQRNDPRFNNA
ncbi:hypothetical protein [Burkholderia ubonensis]|nr:hypothetical protein [Burkholderia ubonensis]